jgi:hypothetical protein
MQRSVQYVDRNGRELNEHEAHDRRGILRDGVALRTSLTMLDQLDEDTARRVERSKRVTDAAGNTGFHRPGFRMQLGDEAGQHEKERALAAYEKQLCDSWKTTHRDPKGRMVGTSETEETDQDDDGDKKKRGKRNSADVLADEYRAYDADLSSSYLTPTGFGSHNMTGQHEGDLCMLNGFPGHLRKVRGKLECVPDNADAAALCPVCGAETDASACTKCGYEQTAEEITNNMATHTESGAADHRSVTQLMKDHAARMENLYAARDEELRSAWRR